MPTRSWQELRTINEIIYSTFAEAARLHGLILDPEHEARTAMLLAKDLRRSPSPRDLRFLFALGFESEATDQMLFDVFKDAIRDEGDTDDSIRWKIKTIIGHLRSTMDPFQLEGLCPSTSHEGLSLSFAAFVSGQAAIATEIISAVEKNTKKLMFLQGNAGKSKTHSVGVILSELHRLGICCLVSATTGIAAAQSTGANWSFSVSPRNR
jgi:hypothetical protein